MGLRFDALFRSLTQADSTHYAYKTLGRPVREAMNTDEHPLADSFVSRPRLMNSAQNIPEPLPDRIIPPMWGAWRRVLNRTMDRNRTSGK